jgi:hypothetical protein
MLSAEVFNKKSTNEVNVPESCDETEEIVQEEQKTETE